MKAMEVLDRALHEMASGAARKLTLSPGFASAHNDGDAMMLSDLPMLKRRPLESALMRLAGAEKWSRFMASPAQGLTFRHLDEFQVAVRYEPSGPVAVFKHVGESS